MHLLCAYLGFVFLSLHLGLHWGNILNMAERLFKKRSAARKWVIRVIGWLIAAYAIYAFIKRNFAWYMFKQIHFVFFNLDEPMLLYLLDYIAIMGAFVCAGNNLTVILRKAGRKRKRMIEYKN